MKRPAFLTAAAAALLAAATASAQTPTVEARIVPDSIGIGDTFTLEIDVERDQVQVTEFPLYENDDKIEVVQSLRLMEAKRMIDKEELGTIKQWFSDYLTWMSTHRYGIKEMEAKNNHGTCWVMQAAAFALFTDNREMIRFCTERYKTVLLPNQMAADGSFPLELERTKPYGYSLFNLDAMATICQLLTTGEEDIWNYTTPDGKNIDKGIA